MVSLSHFWDSLGGWFADPNNILVIIGTMATVATLIIAILTYRVSKEGKDIAYKSYHQIDREPPWKLEKISSTRWNLVRNHLAPATLYGYAVDNHNSVRVNYDNAAAALPLKVFTRGSYVTFTVDGPIGGNITFYYREFDEDKDLSTIDVKDYHGELGRNPDLPLGVDKWSNYLC